MIKRNINYIVSGLERSGTSMIMQMLEAGGVPVAYDSKRKSDENNPKGYYELAGGKIIDIIKKDQTFLDQFKGKFVKVTAYGIPMMKRNRECNIIYIERDINEVLKSTEKMTGKPCENKEEMTRILTKVNEEIKKCIDLRRSLDCIVINYNKILESPEDEIKKIIEYIGAGDLDKMVKSVDKSLYRNKYESKKHK
jgi:hypothetical protein